jgi:hypothetical protein
MLTNSRSRIQFDSVFRTKKLFEQVGHKHQREQYTMYYC